MAENSLCHQEMEAKLQQVWLFGSYGAVRRRLIAFRRHPSVLQAFRTTSLRVCGRVTTAVCSDIAWQASIRSVRRSPTCSATRLRRMQRRHGVCLTCAVSVMASISLLAATLKTSSLGMALGRCCRQQCRALLMPMTSSLFLPPTITRLSMVFWDTWDT